MKKVFFLLVFAGLAVVVLHSCRKDGLNSRNPEQTAKTYTAQEMQIWQSLTNFNDKVKNGVRDEEFISPDSAMWYLEALYNVTEAHPSVSYNELFTDTTFYSLPLNENGNVSITDVSLVYNQMVSDMQSALSNFSEDFKYLVMGDVFNSTINRDGNAEIGLINGYGLNILRLYSDFTEQDNWYYGNMYGMCNGDSLWDSDAGGELEKRFNNPDIMYSPPHDTAHAINVEKNTATYLEYPQYIYNMKWVHDSISDTCIYYQALQYYLVSGHVEIIYKDTTNGGKRIPGKDFFVIDVTSNTRGAIFRDSLYYHNYDLWYANFINLPPIGD